jgi:hypothetical protein
MVNKNNDKNLKKKSMLRTFLLLILICPSFFGQTSSYKPFTGTLTYKVELMDSTLKKGIFQYYMRVYTNDTLVRTETESVNFGKQIVIRHLHLNKQYLLLTHNDKKYAIQQNLAADTSSSKYTFDLINKKKKFAKTNGYLAYTHLKNSPFTFETYYSKELNPIYLNIFKGIPGLPISYFILSDNGILKYTLIEKELVQLPKNAFLFSKEYQQISFNDFIEAATKNKE